MAFSQCIYDGATQVEGITARRADGPEQADRILAAGEVPVLADPAGGHWKDAGL